MDESQIDWTKTSFEGSRREQLRRWKALTLRQRLEALDAMTDTAQRFAEMRARAAEGRTDDRSQASP